MSVLLKPGSGSTVGAPRCLCTDKGYTSSQTSRVKAGHLCMLRPWPVKARPIRYVRVGLDLHEIRISGQWAEEQATFTNIFDAFQGVNRNGSLCFHFRPRKNLCCLGLWSGLLLKQEMARQRFQLTASDRTNWLATFQPSAIRCLLAWTLLLGNGDTSVWAATHDIGLGCCLKGGARERSAKIRDRWLMVDGRGVKQGRLADLPR